MRIAIVQSVIENTLEQNRDKILNFIPKAKAEGCEVVIFPEASLYWTNISVDAPKKADIDAAIQQIGEKAKAEGIYVIFSSQSKYTDDEAYHNLGIVYDANGNCLVSYVKNDEVPQAFLVNGVSFNLSVCSDRGYLEHSDLPCLTQGAQVIVDTSGGHGGDDGRLYLRLIRYRPWAVRTNAFVIVCNPPHDDTDFMGNSPWGGGSAVIRPDGTVQVSLAYEKDIMIVEEIDLSLATRAEAERRRNDPILKPFWNMGKTLIDGGNIPSIPDITPYKSQEREIKIAAAQIACSRVMADNVKKITDQIQQAARRGADVVVFPELAVTGSRKEDIESAGQELLDSVLTQIKNRAESEEIYVIVGMPYFVDGKRKNCAFVIGDDGKIKTRYEQLNATRTDLFQPGASIKNMWFQLKGVYSIVTIGDDSKWVEIADLAANRGMYLHFHVSYATDASSDDEILRRQQNLLMLTYAGYGAVVNAADPAGLPDPSSPASGLSMITSREGGHNRPAPDGLEYYLPYQTSVVGSASSDETMIYATRKTTAGNNMDLMKNWRNRTRRNRAQKGWYDWIKFGAQLVEKCSLPEGRQNNRRHIVNIERWDTHEISFTASKEYKNPFCDVELTGTFRHEKTDRTIRINGFYDGGSTWRIRFMPTELGTWGYETESADPGLGGKSGEIRCIEPTKPYLHGPISTSGHHFVHADGTRRLIISTRLSCPYASPEVWNRVIDFLKEYRINRVFFIMGGIYGTIRDLYGKELDFSRYNVEKFRRIDAFIGAMRQADILASPYFYYFNDRDQRKMTPEQDKAYIRYGMARFGAYANVMPVLSNEVEQKFTDRRGQYELASHNWGNEMGSYMSELAVFGVPVAVHNPMETDNAINPGFYTLLQDWPFPWTDFMLRQVQVAALSTAPELRDDIPEQKEPIYNVRGYSRHNQLFIDLRRFGIPVINEEPGYEMYGRSATPKDGKINLRPWNSQTPDTLLPTFWTAVVAGGYVMWGHYDTYEMDDPLPGMKRSQTPEYLKILHDFVTAIPYWEMEPMNDLVSPNYEIVEEKPYRMNFCLAKPGEIYLIFSLNGGMLTVDLTYGDIYRLTQMDPRTGEKTDLGELAGGEQSISVSGKKQVLLLKALE